MVYLAAFAVALVAALSYLAYKYGSLDRENHQIKKDSKEVANAGKKLADELVTKEEEIQLRDKEIVELALENDDTDAVVDLLNELFQNEGSDDKLPN